MNQSNISNSQQNNFDGVRIFLALIVLFSHLSAITNNPAFWYLEKFADANFAVKGFFTISGYLVCKSFIGSKNLTDFFEKRVRRIYPAYIGAVALCFLIGIFVSRLDILVYLSSPESFRYLAFNALFLNFLQPSLPGVFENNHLQAMDGSLWTIKVEVMLYLCVPFLIFCLRRFSSGLVALVFITASIAWVYYFEQISSLSIGSEIARQFPGQLSYFVCGTFLAVEPRFLKQLKWIAPLGMLLLIMLDNSNLKVFIDPFAYSGIVLFICTLKSNYLNVGKFGDISYGIYLYHFPIIQLLVFLGIFEINIYWGAALAFIVTLMMSLLSWHFLEKPFLKRSSYYIEAEFAKS